MICLSADQRKTLSKACQSKYVLRSMVQTMQKFKDQNISDIIEVGPNVYRD